MRKLLAALLLVAGILAVGALAGCPKKEKTAPEIGGAGAPPAGNQMTTTPQAM